MTIAAARVLCSLLISYRRLPGGLECAIGTGRAVILANVVATIEAIPLIIAALSLFRRCIQPRVPRWRVLFLQDDRDRSIVMDLDQHVRLKSPTSDRDTVFREELSHSVDQGLV